MFGNFCDPEVQGVDLLCSSPLLVAASDLQDLVVAVHESRHTMFRIIYNNNQILTYDKGLLPASWRAWTVLGDQLFGQPG